MAGKDDLLPNARSSRRRRASKELQHSLTAFYGAGCVTDGDEADTHLHHLDGENSNTVFENLLPVSAGINGAIERNVSNFKVRPGYLSDVAEDHYKRSRFARAYGCARLAAFIASADRNHQDSDQAINSAGKCVAYLRAIEAPGPLLILDTLRRTALPALQSTTKRPSQLATARFCEQVANLFREQVLTTSYQRWHELVGCLLRQAPESPGSKALVILRKRHHAFFLLDQGRLGPAMNAMSRAADVAEDGWQWDKQVTAGNDFLWNARYKLIDKNPEASMEELRRARTEGLMLSETEFRMLDSLVGAKRTDIRSQLAMQTLLAEVDWRMGRASDAMDRANHITLLYEKPPYVARTKADDLPVLREYRARYGSVSSRKFISTADQAWLGDAVFERIQGACLDIAKRRSKRTLLI